MRVAVFERKSHLFRDVIKMNRTFRLFHLISLPGVVCGFEKTRIAPAGRNFPLTTSIREIYCAALRFTRRLEKPFLRGPGHTKKSTRLPRKRRFSRSFVRRLSLNESFKVTLYRGNQAIKENSRRSNPCTLEILYRIRHSFLTQIWRYLARSNRKSE